ncbi:hypothetical protein L2E82_24649 [Cichorium intybus]|uniref:Uncharacterized protein n=1 Tax=Cichorium intybus TaxID=13427 RepID=A0ACB9E124_CICIN|nr:hypothetical protein L2E82_24649 [Cichorium intybus]
MDTDLNSSEISECNDGQRVHIFPGTRDERKVIRYEMRGEERYERERVCEINNRHYCCSNHDHLWFKKPIGGKISEEQEGGVNAERAAASMDPPAMVLNRSKGEPVVVANDGKWIR